MSASEQEIGTILSVISRLDSVEQITRIREALRLSAERIGRQNVGTLRKGDRVYFNDGKTGVKHLCTVERVKQVWVEVIEDNGKRWNVRAPGLVRVAA